MADIIVRAGVVTDAAEVSSRPITDVSLLLMLDKPSVAKLRGALPSPLQLSTFSPDDLRVRM